MTHEEVEQLAAHWTASQRTVAAFIRSLVTDFHASEEVLQRVAVTLVRKYEHYDPTRPFVAWALGIARIEAVMFFREQGKDRLVFDDALVGQITETHERVAENASPMPQFVHECVEELDGRSRKSIQLRYADNLRTAEIARKMQLSDGAVRMLLSRARTLLRECLESRIARWKESQ